MCDTFIALPDATLNGDVIFGKNSDRPGNEIQDVVACPAQDFTHASTLRCTYIAIPQVAHTHAVILSKPRWMWGAEMGANEHGVVIGNEAVWTSQPCANSGLLGMDLLRLGLERGDTAINALELMVELLNAWGQGGNCAEHFSFTYHNSFLIADPDEAWVLETADKFWVAERVTGGTRSISNNLSIRGKGDLRHPDLNNETDFDFARYFSDGRVTDPLSPVTREGRVRLLCRQNEKSFTEETVKSILRDHECGICMHGDFETRGSQISVLSEIQRKHWFIEGPFPCEQEYQLKTFIS
jgi:secernin